MVADDDSSLDDFCGSPFWDTNLTWHTSTPELTPCFEKTVLVWVPCGIFWLLAPLEMYSLLTSLDRSIPWTWINVSKIVGSVLLLALQLVDLFHAVHAWKNGEDIYGVHFLAPLILASTFVLYVAFVIVGKIRGIQSSGRLFTLWLLLFVCGLPGFISYLTPGSLHVETVDTLSFATYMTYFSVVMIMFIINCFSDGTPQYLSYPRSKKYCPEASASFLSRLCFSWMDGLVWQGYRTPLECSDLWDLSQENTSCFILQKWDHNWRRYTARSFTKEKMHTGTHASFSKENVEVRSVSKRNHHYLLPIMFWTFAPTFLLGALLKLVHDFIQFISPQILSLLIDFIESSEVVPAWHGYLYAVGLFVCSQIQSIMLGQYFKVMMVIGLHLRTVIISTVYRKALRLSSRARKGTTVGEIVNLMSVDAQRFMDICGYINMLWSAPLQIGISVYFLWNLLGPSVLAGVAILVALIPGNGLIAKKMEAIQIKEMKVKDVRVKHMTEILNGIKVLKLYAWEDAFEAQVKGIRSKEIGLLKNSAYVETGVNLLWNSTPFMVSLATFATYVSVSSDNVLDANKAFVSLSLFNLMRFPFLALPMVISSLVQVRVSLKRLNKFMNAQELDPNCVSRDNTENEPIIIENGTFLWDEDKDENDEANEQATLSNIDLRVGAGALVAIVGGVGAGKSSLCSAILGEIERRSGRVNVKGSVAYVPQEAWIQNATLENNITFNQKRNDEKYQACIKSCALQSDLEILPGGDQTEIGEKGINLSGGQKQRVSLARAVYSDTDIYLLDDPLSAVDTHVGRHIFDEVIGPQGVLKNKTRLMVTHGLTYLPQTDYIVVMKDGRILEKGTYHELLRKKGPFQEFLLQYLSSASEDLDDLEDIKYDLENTLGNEFVEQQLSRLRRKSESESFSNENLSDKIYHRLRKPSECEVVETVEKNEKDLPSEKDEENLIEAEKSNTGKVGLEVYKYYIASFGLKYMLLAFSLYGISEICIVFSSLWLAKWSTEETNDPDTRDLYIGVYGGLGFGQALIGAVADLLILYCMITASFTIHQRLLSSTMKFPQSFFDTNPVGRITNRFSKDTDSMDTGLPRMVLDLFWTFFEVLATLFVITYATPMFVAVMVPTLIIYVFLQIIFVATSRQLKRLESVSLSPIYSHFQESIQGSSSIRAYCKQQEFIKESDCRVDSSMACYYPTVVSNRWLALRLELMGNIITFSSALFAVIYRDTIGGGKAGLSVTYALSITQSLHWLVRMFAEVETNIVAVERIKEYIEKPQEAPRHNSQNQVHKEWPQEGSVEFVDYSTRYRKGLSLVIKNLDLKINPGEKIGIVGRTGAGKSSLTLALFRLIEAAGGNITIDGVNISKLGLYDLRSRLTIIPQDPVLFSGTLRMNLDPLGSKDDSKVWSALEHAHLKDFVASLPLRLQHPVAESGENLSMGQRQLVCLARALLRKTRILVLDEATAAVDLETDNLIQQTITTEFADCTVITIAHRLHTIMDSSRVVVLDAGEIKEFDSPSSLLINKDSVFYGMAKQAGLI